MHERYGRLAFRRLIYQDLRIAFGTCNLRAKMTERAANILENLKVRHYDLNLRRGRLNNEHECI